MFQLPDAGIIILLNILSVFLIVKRHRFDVEKRIRQRFGVDRHWWIPLVALITALVLSVVSFSSIRVAVVEKFEIIVLIFSFGVMAEGLRESGFFSHLAYRIVEIGEGSTSKLILYMFLLTSSITFFTSNDIVVYILTPIIVSICFQAGIKNTKLLLLSQFIAANTLSMGMLIGSPTNLIIAESVGLDFFSYLFLMVLPSFVAFLSSFILLVLTIKLLKAQNILLFRDLKFKGSYSVPENNPEPDLTTQMRNWVLIFAFFVFLVAIVTVLDYSLIWCATPAILISLGYWHFSKGHENSVRKPLSNLPYGILFFGMTFFIFAEEFSRTGFVNTELLPLMQKLFAEDIVSTAFSGVFGSGIMVNLFLDLPSAAIISELLPKLELASVTTKILIQGTLVGLNIGTYVTSIGALAGLIWFEEMRLQRKVEKSKCPEQSEQMIFPDRIDLLRYGIMHFVFTGAIVATFLVIEGSILKALTLLH